MNSRDRNLKIKNKHYYIASTFRQPQLQSKTVQPAISIRQLGIWKDCQTVRVRQNDRQMKRAKVSREVGSCHRRRRRHCKNHQKRISQKRIIETYFLSLSLVKKWNKLSQFGRDRSSPQSSLRAYLGRYLQLRANQGSAVRFPRMEQCSRLKNTNEPISIQRYFLRKAVDWLQG